MAVLRCPSCYPHMAIMDSIIHGSQVHTKTTLPFYDRTQAPPNCHINTPTQVLPVHDRHGVA